MSIEQDVNSVTVRIGPRHDKIRIIGSLAFIALSTERLIYNCPKLQTQQTTSQLVFSLIAIALFTSLGLYSIWGLIREFRRTERLQVSAAELKIERTGPLGTSVETFATSEIENIGNAESAIGIQARDRNNYFGWFLTADQVNQILSALEARGWLAKAFEEHPE